ncbi:MAG TPA: hypothetical protein VFA11_19655 [Acidimicrobiales bacterium]|nr:hypothetical protein [Acidimicrobiales bacterium]
MSRSIGALAAARVVLGAGLLLFPGLARPWLGDSAGDRATRVVVRSFAARDAIIGAGALIALRRQRPVRGWVEAGAAADGADAVASLLAWGRLPTSGRLVPLFAAAGAAAGGWLASACSDDSAGDRHDVVVDLG